MKKIPTKRFDFFTAFHREKFHKIISYLFSSVFAIFLAFSFVSYSQNGNLNGLMASVANLTKSTQYDADLILQKSGTSLKFVLGSTAEKVDRVDFTLLSDPAHFRGITSSDSSITISSLGEGMFHVQKTFVSQTIPAGTVVTVLQADIDEGVVMSLVDTDFTSEGAKYSLTNKVE